MDELYLPVFFKYINIMSTNISPFIAILIIEALKDDSKNNSIIEEIYNKANVTRGGADKVARTEANVGAAEGAQAVGAAQAVEAVGAAGANKATGAVGAAGADQPVGAAGADQPVGAAGAAGTVGAANKATGAESEEAQAAGIVSPTTVPLKEVQNAIEVLKSLQAEIQPGTEVQPGEKVEPGKSVMGGSTTKPRPITKSLQAASSAVLENAKINVTAAERALDDIKGKISTIVGDTLKAGFNAAKEALFSTNIQSSAISALNQTVTDIITSFEKATEAINLATSSTTRADVVVEENEKEKFALLISKVVEFEKELVKIEEKIKMISGLEIQDINTMASKLKKPNDPVPPVPPAPPAPSPPSECYAAVSPPVTEQLRKQGEVAWI